MVATFAAVNGTLGDTLNDTTDLTSSGFGTPAGALLFSCDAGPSANPADSSRVSVGFFDGTNSRTNYSVAEDNKSSANTARFQHNTNALKWITADLATIVAYTAANITDGIRLTCSDDSTGIERYVGGLLLGGTASCDVGDLIPSNTNGGTASVTGLSYEPDLVFFGAVGIANGFTSQAMHSYGVAINDGSETQRVLSHMMRDNQSTNYCRQRLSTARVGGEYFFGWSWSGELTAFNSDGFEITTRDGGAGGDRLYYMAWHLDGGSSWLGTLTTPTSTGDDAHTSAGFMPDAGVFGASLISSADTDSSHVSAGIGVSDGTNDVCIAWRDENNVGTTDSSQEFSSSEVINLRDVSDGTDEIVATLSSFDANGRTLNYGTTDTGTARLGYELLMNGGGGAAAEEVLTAPQLFSM